MQLDSSERNMGSFWDPVELKWKTLRGKPLIVKDKSILLVPKSIVRSAYAVNVEIYISQYILKEEQQYHLDNRTELCHFSRDAHGNEVVKPPTIDELKKHIVYGKARKDFAFKYSQEKPESEKIFLRHIKGRILVENFKALGDEKLDEIVYWQDVV